MSTPKPALDPADEIAATARSGGANTSHTAVIPALMRLLEAVPNGSNREDYERAVLEDNVLGKETDAARRRTLRYLTELYLLRPDSLLFRALRDLWPDDPDGRPLLAGLCALARDTALRASRGAIVDTSPGAVVTSDDLASSVEAVYPGHYNALTLAKIGRNTFASWEQTGHLEPDRVRRKVRRRAICRPAAVAYALLLGHLEGRRGHALFESAWAEVLDVPRSHAYDLAVIASQRGMLEFRRSGDVIEVGFRELLREAGGQGR